tara:strand:- start:77 stop:322 length:246 start_codon:yes stop_codon:yes gene_type:complete
MRKQKQKHRQENTLTNSAFTGDLESLMDKARDVVKIIEKYTDDGSDGDDGSSSDEVKSLLEVSERAFGRREFSRDGEFRVI